MNRVISLEDLLLFQQSNNPDLINANLTKSSTWLNNESDFSDKSDSYSWYYVGDTFDPEIGVDADSTDELYYIYRKPYMPAILYTTYDKQNFQLLVQEVQNSKLSLISSEIVGGPNGVNYSVYSDNKNTIELYESLASDKNSCVLMVFAKKDYDDGYRIR